MAGASDLPIGEWFEFPVQAVDSAALALITPALIQPVPGETSRRLRWDRGEGDEPVAVYSTVPPDPEAPPEDPDSEPPVVVRRRELDELL